MLASEHGQNIWKYAFASVAVTVSSLGFGRMSYGILMPFMKENLEMSYKQAGMLATTISIGYLVMVIFVGLLAAKVGAKKLVIFGTGLVSFGLFILSLVPSYGLSMIAMLILGIGTAFTYTPLITILVGWFPRKRGMLIGFLVSGMGLGTLISSALIPFFTTWFGDMGWRYLWFFYGVLSIVSIVIAMSILRDPPIPLLKKEQQKRSFWKFVYFNKRVLRVAFIYGLVGFTYLVPQSFLFSYILEVGLTKYQAGQIMAISGVMAILSGPLWGGISDRIGRKSALLCTLGIGAVSLLIPVLFPVYIGLIASQFFWGATIVGMLSLCQAMSTEQVHPTYAPVALGYVTFFFAAGQLFGPGIGGWIIDHFQQIPLALIMCSVSLAVAFVLSIRMKEHAVDLDATELEAKPVPSA
ncbi:YbfB/YjiJ family MFS transporter [Sporosarcina sp. GW1-11]|uniref:YbfB/YjiJ family MFS transporter n=1 Tax=Sporosarcina sp. GW1-11 TaxID=2899126 RepID=UPI00294E32C4|nr:YbfB/YjiJ family MFS transporter [Sporosarcina sp. GW1-11]MDV6379501.1 YbfB/YjiJ family MFS transporter [Sporosarcina sp. GW1-11]